MAMQDGKQADSAVEPNHGPLRGIDHIGIAVHDLDEAIELFTEAFGLRLVAVEDNPDQQVREATLVFGGGPQDGPDGGREGGSDGRRERGGGHGGREGREGDGGPAGGGGQAYVQLVAPLGPDSPVARYLETHRPGLHHLAFAVEDLTTAATSLRGRGVEVLYDADRPGTSGTRINFVHPRQAGGTLVELVEHPPTS